MSDPSATPLESILAQRRKKLESLLQKGVTPYPYHFDRTHTLAQLLKDFDGPLPEHGSEQLIRTAVEQDYTLPASLPLPVPGAS